MPSPPLKTTRESANRGSLQQNPVLWICLISACIVAGGGIPSCCVLPIMFVLVAPRTDKGAGPSEPREQPLQKPEDRVVFLSIDVEVQPNKRVIVRGNTNLPPTTSLMFGVWDAITDECQGQSRGTVSANGSFVSEPLGPLMGLRDGEYFASVTMPMLMAGTQPESVRNAIGDAGQHLKGPIVESGVFGNFIDKKERFAVGGENVIRVPADRATTGLEEYKELTAKIMELLSRLEKVKQRGLRDDDNNLANNREWGIFIRAFQEDCETLDNRVDRIDSILARGRLSDLLREIGMMSLHLAFKRESQYHHSKEYCAELLKDLEEFIKEIESKNPRIQ